MSFNIYEKCKWNSLSLSPSFPLRLSNAKDLMRARYKNKSLQYKKKNPKGACARVCVCVVHQ